MTLTEERGTTVVEVDQPTRLRILETWKGPVAEVEL
jgi:hypothetical protein